MASLCTCMTYIGAITVVNISFKEYGKICHIALNGLRKRMSL